MKMKALYDTRYAIETPEGVELELTPAGVPVRAVAFLIDFSIRALFFLAVAFIVGFAGALSGESGGMAIEGLFLIIFFLLEWFYPVYFEVSHEGRTPGKRAMSIKVLSMNGTPVTLQQSLLRNLLRAADLMPFAYAIGLVTALQSKYFQRLGDIAANTLVVYATSHRQEEPDFGEIVPEAPPQALSLPEQQALINFSTRAQTLSRGRVHELALILKPLTGLGDSNAAKKLFAYAAWFLGVRK